MASRLPFDIREGIVKVCGMAFHYKDRFRDFMLACGVPADLYERFAEESKYKITRHLLFELDSKGEEGYQIQRRILTELCTFRNLPDENATNRDGGLNALRALKQLALDQGLVVRKAQAAAAAKAARARRRHEAITARAKKTRELQHQYATLATSAKSPQIRGYRLEDILAELFAANEIAYRPSYRTGTEQIDGSFDFRGFHYLVEARWRKNPPTEADLAALKTKVDKKITSTRGLFVSIAGFRIETVAEFTRGVSSNIILMDGQDLSLILEGHVSLVDALAMKIEKASQEGKIFVPLSERF